ncbi:SPOR domain-containing protein [Wenzhouxiangella sp. XN79A]|uniref:SPOR domain-containing protein n=1 Tax=Wenzhouxiangella sp. XN79A TaxID=2724193 RepID=UPI00144A90B6|nr:SPOR domain-containing protein [Wenzhouxiangella sp. XN79A]NKI34249.1 SPOR domain-containing protein [Wenzhouxiangella sp. XN79A]
MAWRIAAVLLVVVNLALLVLGQMQPPPAPRLPPPVADPDIPQLELIALDWQESQAQGPRCFTIGPFATLVQQSRAEDRLRPFASEIRPRRTEADRDRGWWVFVAAPSRSSAIELAQELASRGVEDYFVVADEDLPDAVSLGLFERRENARARLARIRSMGFDAQLAVRREDIPQFWLDYRIDPGERSPWRFILRSSPGAKHFAIPCF